MKYCVYCGNKVDEKNDICPYCKRSIAEEKTNCIPHVNIKCVKCGSSNINYQIKEKNIDDVTFEDIEYTCQDCKKKFNDFDRLGPSFNNKYQLIFSRAEKKAIKWLIIFIVAIVIIAYKSISRIYEETNWELMDCSGLPKMSFIQIKEGAPDNDYKYKENFACDFVIKLLQFLMFCEANKIDETKIIPMDSNPQN